MSDQGAMMGPGMDPGMMDPAMMDPAMQPQPEPMQPPAPEPQEGPEAELVRAIEHASRAAQLSDGPTAAEDVWHYGQGAFYFAQALAILLGPVDPAAAQAEAKAAMPAPPAA